MEETELDIILARSVSGNATREEQMALGAWLQASEENRRLHQEAMAIWEASEQPLKNMQKSEDFQKVLLEITKVQIRQLNKQKRKSKLYLAAAILAIPVVLAVGLLYMKVIKKGPPSVEQYCEISAPKGHLAQSILPDGTEVWINTGSSVSYHPGSFNEISREVHLTGEAYFKVTRNSDMPFQVITEYSRLTVTGTAFQVKAYPLSMVFETVLEEGSVDVVLDDQSEQTVKLVMNERLVYDLTDKSVTVEKVDAQYYTSWRNGEILFKDATLHDLIREMEKIYNINFVLENPKLGDFRFRGMLSYSNNLIETLEKIKRTSGIDYYIRNNIVHLSK